MDNGGVARLHEHTEVARGAVEGNDVLTVDEVAALLRVNRKTVYEAFRRDELPGGRRIGRVIRFSRSALLRWLDEDTPRRRRR